MTENNFCFSSCAALSSPLNIFSIYILQQVAILTVYTSDMIVQFVLRNLGIGLVVKDFAEEYVRQGSLLSDNKIPIKNGGADNPEINPALL